MYILKFFFAIKLCFLSLIKYVSKSKKHAFNIIVIIVIEHWFVATIAYDDDYNYIL